MWLLAAVLGTLTLPTGLLSPGGALDVLERTVPVLAFLVAATVLAELADAAELFDVAAARAARVARGRTPLLFLLVVVLASLTTVVLSLDTTAVLLTPVVLALTARLGLAPWPFALATVWLANTASLLLPVSNLTNLLALHHLHLTTGGYVRVLAIPAGVAVLVTAALLVALHHRDLRGRYAVPEPHPAADPVLLGAAGVCAAALVPALLLGAAPWMAATGTATALVAAFAWRRPQSLRPDLLPWRLVLLTTGLFLVVAALGSHGLDGLLRDGAGSATQTAVTGAVGSNVVNNLPAYLAVERVTPPEHLTALLLGVNLGPLVAPWGSLATLLWAERCRARGLEVPWGRFALSGLLAVPVLLAATLAVR